MSLPRRVLAHEAAPDEELMRQFAAGRESALAILYHRYAPVIVRMACTSLEAATADDIVQDVFVAVWRHAAVFTPERGRFRSWVLQIAHNRILNELRSRRRRVRIEADTAPDSPTLERLPDEGRGPDEEAWNASMRAEVRNAVEQLPASQREVLDLAFFKDLTHRQAATHLAVPLGTAKTRIRAGLKTLRTSLAPFVAGEKHEALVGTRSVPRGGDRAPDPQRHVGKQSIRGHPAPAGIGGVRSCSRRTRRQCLAVLSDSSAGGAVRRGPIPVRETQALIPPIGIMG
jgi:RNA polymerase sigma-70 factor, ECF subfamily